MNIKQTKELMVATLEDLLNSEESILNSVSRKQHKNCKSCINDLHIQLNAVCNTLDQIKIMQELKKGGDK